MIKEINQWMDGGKHYLMDVNKRNIVNECMNRRMHQCMNA